MISKEEVKHIAKLARLELGRSSSQASAEKEIEKMQKDLSSVLDYFDLLKKAPRLVKIKRADDLKEDLKTTRTDEVGHKKLDLVKKLIKALPDKKDDYIKVKTIHESFRTNN